MTTRQVQVVSGVTRTSSLLILFVFLTQATFGQSRSTLKFNAGWKFYLGDDSLASKPGYIDTRWRSLNLPHDWSVELPFSATAPATNQGGALPGGVGWYRKTFNLPLASRDKNVLIKFDGVYRNSEVWINGHYLGKRPNGYISFQYDLGPYLQFGAAKNVIAVKVDNSQQPNSRWYTGSGIYRDVELVTTNKIYIEKQGLFFSPVLYSHKNGTWGDYDPGSKAQVYGDLRIHSLAFINKTGRDQDITSTVVILDSAGKRINQYRSNPIRVDTGAWGTKIGVEKVDAVWGVKDPILWSPERPYLYKAVTSIFQKGKLLDEVTTNIGFRQFGFDREKGFFLNGKQTKIHGVCLHHDLGVLGAAFNYRAAERQLQILKAMGCNAIRTAHNPPAAKFLDLCDKMGFLVMDESFDIWQKRKNKFDYSADFKQWYRQDLEEMVLRDRNHPSIFMWSIGNEIREQFDSTGLTITKELAHIVKRLDPTRPVTSALTETDTAKNFIYQSNALDVTGWNYNQQNFPAFLERYPGKKFIGAETTSALQTRGHYDMPSDSIRTWPPKGQKEMPNVNGDWTVSAYDNVKANWGSTHEETWKIIKKHDFLSGLFVWTGFDYLGEPTPYPWPARSSYFGIIDLAGFPKDVYYMYQSEWTTKPVLHLFPHWNWEQGKLVDVWAYYNNADEVELFLNGKSLGTRTKVGEELHVMWRVPFSAGTLKVISRKNRRQLLVKEIKTAGEPYRIVLKADRQHIKAGGADISFVTAMIVDRSGSIIPGANNLLDFSISGAATIAGTDNGYQADTTSLISKKRKAWKGLALAVVRSSQKKGNSTLTVNSPGLLPGRILLTTD